MSAAADGAVSTPRPLAVGGQGGQPHDVVLLPLKDLKLSDSESQVERRAHFDKAALKELAVSIEAQGMLQAIVVRKLELERGRVNWVVVAGERRYLAAQIAGWEWVPCNVRVLTDQQVIELQLVENLQREGLHELAEAEAYEQLQELGLNAEQIAAKCGRSPTYVLRRLRLKTLSKACRRAFYDGKLGFTVALELAKLPVHAHQDELLKEVLDRAEEGHWRGPMSAADVREDAEERFLSELKGAPFPVDAAGLIPKVGSCHGCPKRTGAQGALFDQVKGLGNCLDLDCFNAKKKAHGEQLLSAAKDAGQKVLRNQADIPEAYVRLDHQPRHGGKSIKQLLDKDYQPILVQLKTGEVVPVAAAADAKKVMPAAPRDRGMDDYRRRQRAEEKKRALENTYRRAVLTELAGKPFFTSDAGRLADLRLATDQMAHRLSHDTMKALFKAMGWEPIEKKAQYRGKWLDYSGALDKILKGFETENELWQLLRILTVADDLVVYNNQGPPDRKDRLHQMAERLGVAWKLILKNVTDAAAAKAKPKKKAVRK